MDLSIVITTYNSENYLEKNFNMLTSQKNFNDFKFIFSDDCSFDNTKKILNNISKRYSNVEVIFNKKNKGAMGNRISGINKVKTKFFILLDSDDFIDLSVLKKINIKNNVTILPMYTINLNNNIDKHNNYSKYSKTINLLLSWWSLSSIIFTKESFSSIHFLDDKDYGEDFNMIQLFNNKICFKKGKPFYYYIKREKSSSSNYKTRDFLYENFLNTYNFLCEKYKNKITHLLLFKSFDILDDKKLEETLYKINKSNLLLKYKKFKNARLLHKILWCFLDKYFFIEFVLNKFLSFFIKFEKYYWFKNVKIKH